MLLNQTDYVASNSRMICKRLLERWIVVLYAIRPRSFACGYDDADGRTKDIIQMFTIVIISPLWLAICP
jgi:hypothetical protein